MSQASLPEALAAALASFVDERIAAVLADDWIDQDKSPLGRKRHLVEVRAGRLPGRRVGKRVLVRRADLDAYIARFGVERHVEAAVVEEDPELAATRAAARRRRRTR